MYENEEMRFDMLNAAIRDEVRAYFVDHKEPSPFLRSVLENDLFGLVKTAGAGDINLAYGLTKWLDDFTGGAKCFGSAEAVEKWLKAKPKKAPKKAEAGKKPEAEKKTDDGKKTEVIENFGHDA